MIILQSSRAVEYACDITAEDKQHSSLKTVRSLTQNPLLIHLNSWRFGEFGISLQYPMSTLTQIGSTVWNYEIVALEKTTSFQIRLMKTCFLFLL